MDAVGQSAQKKQNEKDRLPRHGTPHRIRHIFKYTSYIHFSTHYTYIHLFIYIVIDLTCISISLKPISTFWGFWKFGFVTFILCKIPSTGQARIFWFQYLADHPVLQSTPIGAHQTTNINPEDISKFYGTRAKLWPTHSREIRMSYFRVSLLSQQSYILFLY